MNIDLPTLLTLLAYELHSAKRHSRFTSLVMLTSRENLPTVKSVLTDCLRSSDAMANFDHSVAVLLGETDRLGATLALRRWTSLFHQQIDVQASVASFPNDGDRAEKLLMAAHSRLDKARSHETGTVIVSD